MELDELRKKIDMLDHQLVELLNQRARLVEEVGRVKGKLGLEVYAPEREKEILELAIGQNGGPLSNSAVVRLFERILDESRSLERHIVEDEKGK
jgi:chorismate mutase